MSQVDEDGYRYTSVLEGADIMQKEKIRRQYLRRVKRVAKSLLYGANLIKAINVLAIGVGKIQCRDSRMVREGAENNGCENKKDIDHVWSVS